MKLFNSRNHLNMNDSNFLNQYNILAKYLAKFNEIKGPRIGDYILLDDGKYMRICVSLGNDFQMIESGHGSFCIQGGSCDYSGACGPVIESSKLRFIHEYKLGSVWFFKDGFPAAHSGIDGEVPFRVFKTDLQETKS